MFNLFLTCPPLFVFDVGSMYFELQGSPLRPTSIVSAFGTNMLLLGETEVKHMSETFLATCTFGYPAR
jgi:hypothetical protein